MKVEAIASGFERWDAFVSGQTGSHGPHLSGWKKVIEDTFGHACHYLVAKANGEVHGVLPLTHLRSRLFGSFLISVPYLNYGGILANSEAAQQALASHAIQLAEQLGVAHLELRHDSAIMASYPTKQHKVAMVLELPSDPDTLWNNFKAKLRSQIRKPMKEGLEVRIGGKDELKSFYHVFSINMRDLGTPVYTLKFFGRILEVFSKNAWICTVYQGEHPIASGFLFGFRETLEIPWASSLREFNAIAPNMLLYWSVLQFAIQQGFKKFDFGRSTPGEGTYKFKEQWGAQPVPLHWQYWLSNGQALPDLSPKNPKYQMAIQLWQKLPVAVTRILGPMIVRNIP